MRQGNDLALHRSGIYVYSSAQKKAAEASRDAYQQALNTGVMGRSLLRSSTLEFYYAESYHQQYLAKTRMGIVV